MALSKGSHALKFGAEFRPIKFPFFQVPDPHGNIGYSQNETAFPLTTKGSTGAAINTVTGDSIASALLGQLDSAQHLDYQLRLLAEIGLGMVRAGRLEGEFEADH